MFFMICQTVCGQFVYDCSNITIGKIDSHGYVYNRSNTTVGRFKSDGVIENRSNMLVGRRINLTLGILELPARVHGWGQTTYVHG